MGSLKAGDGPDTFAGDLDDPWVASIAASLPRTTVRLHQEGPLDDAWLASSRSARFAVVHRSTLTTADLDAARALNATAGSAPRLILCVGGLARYHQVEPWAATAAAILPEATAPQTLTLHLARLAGALTSHRGPRAWTVVSGQGELRRMLVELLAASGRVATEARDWGEAPPGAPCLWDVPLLEDGWELDLAREAKGRPVAALLGFADRATVTRATAAGAVACLDAHADLPVIDAVLDRIAPRDDRRRSNGADPAHALPPSPALIRRERSRSLAENGPGR